VRITPLDIRNHDFPRRLSGYDREEVDTFLRMLAEDYEAALRESQSLRERVNQLELRVQELTASERLLQETLTTAQQLSDDLKQTAVKEAEVMVSEAEVKGEKVLDAAHRRAARLAEDIREMKQVRVRLAAAIRATIETHLGLLDSLAEDEPQNDPDLERRISVLGQIPGERKASPDS
jgi:cell division initiation protein